jgi:hypothetical protein
MNMRIDKNMSYFIQANEHDMSMYAKIQCMNMQRFF